MIYPSFAKAATQRRAITNNDIGARIHRYEIVITPKKRRNNIIIVTDHNVHKNMDGFNPFLIIMLFYLINNVWN